MNQHFIKKCKNCKTIVAQCICADRMKHVIDVLCVSCQTMIDKLKDGDDCTIWGNKDGNVKT